ncbi:MAG TPA: DUF5060 domain-containing protein [archaeon]|nr:DUF5060 domain-containing protein [archaeon]
MSWMKGFASKTGKIVNVGFAILLAGGFLWPGTQALEAQEAGEAPLEVTHSRNTDTVPLYEVFEITFKHEREYVNPFFDVAIEVTFTAPSGNQALVGGFHYGSSAKPKIETRKIQTPAGERREVDYIFYRQDLWKARFAPAEPGEWRYTYVFKNLKGEQAAGEGTFTCIDGRSRNPGFLRRHPSNPFRWVFNDGSPFFPIGLQECLGDGSATGSVLDAQSMEGPFRPEREGRPALPPGAMFQPGPSNNPVNGDVYFRNYARGGFNLFRFSQKNCSYVLYRDLDNYLVQEGVMTDELLRHVRKYGFRVFYGFFGYQDVFNNYPEDVVGMAKLKRFVKYSVDRWGAYVDIWEFLNEQDADDKWYEIMAPYLSSIDPYRHPITTSWERPGLKGIEINAPHWYQREDELESDLVTVSRAREWKKYHKPVIVGEQGNRTDRKNPPPPGVGGVWDERSAVRMRIRNWTALFNEIAFIFWNTSYAKDGHYMNIWLGPKEREYVRAMQDFSYCLDADVIMAPVTVSDPARVRAYGLASKERAGVYLHHFKDHTDPVNDLKIALNVPKAATGYWYSTGTAAILGSFDTPAGRQTFTVPGFTVDLALLITPYGAPDIDKDGTPNHLDLDNDNDGVPDSQDAFPLDPEEWLDADSDLIGDNMDADDNGDGIGDDDNQNGRPDHEEFDLDGDGVDKAGCVPWDAFPLDPKEWRDTDGDGVGDNADIDDDGDGWSDEEEIKARTDPLDKLSFPRG